MQTHKPLYRVQPANNVKTYFEKMHEFKILRKCMNLKFRLVRKN